MNSRTLRLPVITTIEYKGINLIIMDSPTKSSVPYFVEECSRLHVSDIVRVCEDRYPTDEFEKSGIRVHHWEFSDGSPPPDNVLSDWFNLLRARFYTEPKTASSNATGAAGPVAVHCIAGYGRKRKGAFNDRQLAYLTAYHPKSRLRRHGNRCFLM
ncbi:hypothetical protein CRM22_000379 [Opisthorchis felineus]|uniref:Tyrosine specific protein phosphatases domain-containing protein n=1 Tax=Opisthorchis felineus TaxID=147828 RepID=A0A4S2MFJ5_OPIFE|nr:hypothetical protein CRM22_000379 [Opisthorchis felineus]